MSATIWDSIEELTAFLDKVRKNNIIVATSGGFDPLHVGHLRCIQECRYFGSLVVVIVNGDGFLKRKKGYVYMPQKERAELVAGIWAVDHVVLYDDGSQFVAGAIEIIRPNVFGKGGDRSTPESIATQEHEACAKVDCRIEYAVGGSEKIQSSSKLVEKVNNANQKAGRKSGKMRQIENQTMSGESL